MITVSVDLGSRSYDVLVGAGARESLGAVLPAGAKRAAVVTQASVPFAVDLPVEHRVFTIAEGETAKSLATIESLCREWSQWGMNRADVVVAVGGGVVTDVGGFAAAVYHRGIAVVHVPTTLLGMVDAAIGGKTGVNLPEGKNLVGAFWQPAAVVCDTDALATLPPREHRSGMGEMAKYHFLTDVDLMALPLDERVAECVRIKAAVVAADEREGARRAILNYGHTLGHAIEKVERFSWRHGEAIAVGMCFAVRLSVRAGRLADAAQIGRHDSLFAELGLPTRYRREAWPALLAAMRVDKKSRAGRLRLVVLEAVGEAGVLDDVDPELLASVYAEVSA
jgi:5-deoxy-5-amino-3-dehydroquinate synthase